MYPRARLTDMSEGSGRLQFDGDTAVPTQLLTPGANKAYIQMLTYAYPRGRCVRYSCRLEENRASRVLPKTDHASSLQKSKIDETAPKTDTRAPPEDPWAPWRTLRPPSRALRDEGEAPGAFWLPEREQNMRGRAPRRD